MGYFWYFDTDMVSLSLKKGNVHQEQSRAELRGVLPASVLQFFIIIIVFPQARPGPKPDNDVGKLGPARPAPTRPVGSRRARAEILSSRCYL